MKPKKIIMFARKNYFITFFFAIILFVGFFAFYKIVFSKPTYVYAKVKIGQGLWWANTGKPSIWYLEAIKEGDLAKDILGSTQAKILEKRYYRWFGSDSFDIYLKIVLKTNYNKRTGEYTFNRSTISVGSPIYIQFPRINLTGMITDLSPKPFRDEYVDRIVYITKRYAFPWEFEAIKIGDSVSDGKNKIFEVLDKSMIETSNLASDVYGNSSSATSEAKGYITVKVKFKLRNINNQWILGEDQIITPGHVLNISTPSFVFDNYSVSQIVSE